MANRHPKIALIPASKPLSISNWRMTASRPAPIALRTANSFSRAVACASRRSNSCARAQIADIGFKGQLVEDDEGNTVEGFQVHLGGSLGQDSAFGRKLRQHKVLSTELGDYIDRVVRNYVDQRDEGERFAQWAVRADEGALR